MTACNARIDILQLDGEHFGGHADHWRLLSDDPQHDVAIWLQQALDQPQSPLGLCADEHALPTDVWLLQGSVQPIQITQIVAVEHHQPKALCTAYPVLNSPYTFNATITRIVECQTTHQAVLAARLADGSTIYGFDSLYAVNTAQYQPNTTYQIELSAWAYTLEAVPQHQQLLIDDPAAIRHHRALNDILTVHDGKTPDNLQELLAAWQPKSDLDEQPVTIDISKMVAYLYGETIGQEDEAWFQGDIVGKSTTSFGGQDFILYDVALIRDHPDRPIIMRIAYRASHPQFDVGQYIRGNIWLQFKIYATSKT